MQISPDRPAFTVAFRQHVFLEREALRLQCGRSVGRANGGNRAEAFPQRRITADKCNDVFWVNHFL